MKAIYQHKLSGDIFAIQTDEAGNVVAACGPLLGKDFDPKILDYDKYWNTEIQAKITDFRKISDEEYRDILNRNGFFIDFNQKHLF